MGLLGVYLVSETLIYLQIGWAHDRDQLPSLNHEDYGVCQACSTRRGSDAYVLD